MEYENIIVTSENSIGKILLNRPKAMNSLSIMMRDELEDSLSRLDPDDDVFLIMITGDPKTFSAGFDIKEAIEFARIGPGALSAIRELASHILGIDVLEALKFEFNLTSKLVKNADFQDKTATFLKQSGMIK